jgi:hypothetical protein
MALLCKDFGTLWMPLPDELKLQILGYLLPQDQRYEHHDFNKYKNSIYLPKRLLPLLSVPHVAGLAKEIFSGRNTMIIPTGTLPGYTLRRPPPAGTVEAAMLHLDRYRLQDLRKFSDNFRLTRTLFIPPATATPFMRKLHIPVNELNPKSIKFMQNIASGQLGLTTLSSLIICFNCRQSRRFELLALFASIPPIEFPTPYLKITFDHDYNCYRPIYQPHAGALTGLKVWPDILEMPLLEKLTIQAVGSGAEEIWSRLLIQSGAKPEYVDIWPEVVHGYDGRRITTKVVRSKQAQG